MLVCFHPLPSTLCALRTCATRYAQRAEFIHVHRPVYSSDIHRALYIRLFKHLREQEQGTTCILSVVLWEQGTGTGNT